MASLYRHKSKGYQIVYKLYFINGSFKVKHKFAKNKSKAILIYQDVEKLETLALHKRLTQEEIVYFIHRKYLIIEEARLLTADKITNTTLTWDNLADQYLRHITKIGSESTRSVYPYQLRPILRYFENIELITINERLIDRFITDMRQAGRSKATCNKYLSILRIMFDHCVHEGVMRENPARKIKNFANLAERMPRIVYPDELKLVFKKIKQYSYLLGGYFREMLMTYLYTGMRRSELLNLKLSDVNLSDRYLRIEKTKFNKERIIQIHPNLLKVLDSVIAKNADNQNKYFFGGLETPIARSDSITHAFKRFISESGLPEGLTLHSLRHTFITYLLKSGVDLKSVQSIAGHRRISTTYKYIHLIGTNETVSRIDYGE